MELINSQLIGYDLGYVLSILYCLFLATIFVGSLYFRADRNLSRDHPNIIVSRFKRVTLVSIFSLILLYECSSQTTHKKKLSFFQWLGVSKPTYISHFISIFIPLGLTMILFLGPISQQYYNKTLLLYTDVQYWKVNFTDYIWLRNIVMGPLFEEIVFRGCMLPVLVSQFGETMSIFLNPYFFGVAHVHHMLQLIYDGCSLSIALQQAAFQLTYTAIFGIYSAFLFLRTGSLFSSIFVHSFCNHMGFPNLAEISTFSSAKFG